MIKEGDKIRVLDYDDTYEIRKGSNYNNLVDIIGETGIVEHIGSDIVKVELRKENNHLWKFKKEHISRLTRLEEAVNEIRSGRQG